MKIRFQNLQENLRARIWARLERGDLTGKGLALKAGFQQAHLSNFLNAKRGLSLPAMDRLLDVLHLDVLDLAGVNEAGRYARPDRASEDTQPVAVVSLLTAAHSIRFSSDQIQETVTFPKSLLRRLKPRMVGNRRDWTRFVVVKVTEDEATGMSPLLRAGALLLIDRYCNALPARASSPDMTLCAVAEGTNCTVRQVTAFSNSLMLRPLQENPETPVQLVEIQPGRRHADYIIGRVRHVSVDL